MIIRIISAVELEQKVSLKIEEAFRKKHDGQKIEFNFEINPQLIGGVLIIDGENYYDASVSNQLSSIKQQLS